MDQMSHRRQVLSHFVLTFIFPFDIHVWFFPPIAESFYYSVKYGMSNNMAIILSDNLFCFMSLQIFILTQSGLLACFDFNLKEILQKK